MNVNFVPQLEEIVRCKVASGMYTSASEVVREAQGLSEEQDQLRAVRLDALGCGIRVALESGSSEPWKPEAVKREARGPRAAAEVTAKGRCDRLATSAGGGGSLRALGLHRRGQPHSCRQLHRPARLAVPTPSSQPMWGAHARH